MSSRRLDCLLTPLSQDDGRQVDALYSIGLSAHASRRIVWEYTNRASKRTGRSLSLLSVAGMSLLTGLILVDACLDQGPKTTSCQPETPKTAAVTTRVSAGRS